MLLVKLTESNEKDDEKQFKIEEISNLLLSIYINMEDFFELL
jgi:hypothetical protein